MIYHKIKNRCSWRKLWLMCTHKSSNNNIIIFK